MWMVCGDDKQRALCQSASDGDRRFWLVKPKHAESPDSPGLNVEWWKENRALIFGQIVNGIMHLLTAEQWDGEEFDQFVRIPQRTQSR